MAALTVTKSHPPPPPPLSWNGSIYSVRIWRVPLFVFILLDPLRFRHYSAQLLQIAWTRSTGLSLGFMPFVFYIFDYMTSKYYFTSLFRLKGSWAKFLGFVLCNHLSDVFGSLFQGIRSPIKKQHSANQIMEMKRIQSENGLDAINARSEHAVSILRHDMRHFFISISSYIENNDNEKSIGIILTKVIHTF